jgi:hypothetical protein
MRRVGHAGALTDVTSPSKSWFRCNGRSETPALPAVCQYAEGNMQVSFPFRISRIWAGRLAWWLQKYRFEARRSRRRDRRRYPPSASSKSPNPPRWSLRSRSKEPRVDDNVPSDRSLPSRSLFGSLLSVEVRPTKSPGLPIISNSVQSTAKDELASSPCLANTLGSRRLCWIVAAGRCSMGALAKSGDLGCSASII